MKFKLHGLEKDAKTVSNAEGDEGAAKGREDDDPGLEANPVRFRED